MRKPHFVFLTLALGVFASPAPADKGFYTAPTGPFIVSPDDTVRLVTVDSTSAEKVSRVLAEARRNDPKTVVVLRISGTVTVKDAPLRIGSRTCVVFGPKARLVAARSTAAKALIEIADAELVSLSTETPARAVLDGGGRIDTGIEVRASGKVHLDNLHLVGCRKTGVKYTGRGDEAFGDAGSITRCRIDRCRGAGLVVRKSAQFICLDNALNTAGSTGADLESPRALVANNRCVSCSTGIRIAGGGLVVTRNEIRKNRTGLLLDRAAGGCLVTSNSILENGVGIAVKGSACAIYSNKMANLRQFDVHGKGNVIASHRSVKVPKAGVEGNLFFNPPTVANNHRDRIVSGLCRHDVSIRQGGKNPMPLSNVQATLDQARKDHPRDVIVAHLTGRFAAVNGNTGLRVPSNTCVILDGTMESATDKMDHRKSDKGRDTQLVLLAAEGVVSFSGGVLDGKTKPFNVINAPGKNVAVVEGVTVRGAGFNAISTKHRGGPRLPMFINNCKVIDNSNRGIWIHVCRNVHAMGNLCTGNGADGIDLDAYARDSTAMFNICAKNRRHGLFLEEPGATGNTVFANRVHDNRSDEICIYNSLKTKGLGRNLLACNDCTGRKGGTAISLRALAMGNVVFNNACGRGGVTAGLWASRNNYFAQNILSEGPRRIAGNGVIFCTPDREMLKRLAAAQTLSATQPAQTSK
jgi:hypothetical protein